MHQQTCKNHIKWSYDFPILYSFALDHPVSPFFPNVSSRGRESTLMRSATFATRMESISTKTRRTMVDFVIFITIKMYTSTNKNRENSIVRDHLILINKHTFYYLTLKSTNTWWHSTFSTKRKLGKTIDWFGGSS